MRRNRDSIIKAIAALAAIIVIVPMIVRFALKSETVADYAKNHPEEQVTAMVTPLVKEETKAKTDDKDVKSEKVGDEKAKAAVGDKDADNAKEVAESGNIENKDGKDDVKDDEYYGSDECVIFDEGFYYEPVPESVRKRMRGLSYPDDIDESIISFDDLRYVRLLYNDFDGQTAEGEMVCNKAIAQDVVEIFHELYRQDYNIESIRLIDDFDADDTASMSANNTSCFCYRVVDGTNSLSNHAYGRAIDINPFYNPYIVFKKGEDDYISPPGSEIYADRTQNFPYKIDENDLAYRLFIEHGFTWGGNWNSSKDYQHFQKKE